MAKHLLECNAQECVHWMPGDNCNADQIEIIPERKDANCATFALRSLKNAVDERGNFNILGSLAEPFFEDTANPLIYCAVENCKFNDNEFCQAESVRISGSEANRIDETECVTYELD